MAEKHEKEGSVKHDSYDNGLSRWVETIGWGTDLVEG